MRRWLAGKLSIPCTRFYNNWVHSSITSVGRTDTKPTAVQYYCDTPHFFYILESQLMKHEFYRRNLAMLTWNGQFFFSENSLGKRMMGSLKRCPRKTVEFESSFYISLITWAKKWCGGGGWVGGGGGGGAGRGGLNPLTGHPSPWHSSFNQKIILKIKKEEHHHLTDMAKPRVVKSFLLSLLDSLHQQFILLVLCLQSWNFSFHHTAGHVCRSYLLF